MPVPSTRVPCISLLDFFFWRIHSGKNFFCKFPSYLNKKQNASKGLTDLCRSLLRIESEKKVHFSASHFDFLLVGCI